MLYWKATDNLLHERSEKTIFRTSTAHYEHETETIRCGFCKLVAAQAGSD
jgi:hypothetical protein